jgi:hypothetical protein
LSNAFEIVKEARTTIRASQLQKPFEIVKGTLTRTDVAKLNAAAIVRGENNKFNPSIISKFKTPTGQVFVVQPTVTQLQKAFEIVKEAKTIINASQLQKAFEVVKGTPLKIDIAKSKSPLNS